MLELELLNVNTHIINHNYKNGFFVAKIEKIILRLEEASRSITSQYQTNLSALPIVDRQKDRQTFRHIEQV